MAQSATQDSPCLTLPRCTSTDRPMSPVQEKCTVFPVLIFTNITNAQRH